MCWDIRSEMEKGNRIQSEGIKVMYARGKEIKKELLYH